MDDLLSLQTKKMELARCDRRTGKELPSEKIKWNENEINIFYKKFLNKGCKDRHGGRKKMWNASRFCVSSQQRQGPC